MLPVVPAISPNEERASAHRFKGRCSKSRGRFKALSARKFSTSGGRREEGDVELLAVHEVLQHHAATSACEPRLKTHLEAAPQSRAKAGSVRKPGLPKK